MFTIDKAANHYNLNQQQKKINVELSYFLQAAWWQDVCPAPGTVTGFVCCQWLVWNQILKTTYYQFSPLTLDLHWVYLAQAAADKILQSGLYWEADPTWKVQSITDMITSQFIFCQPCHQHLLIVHWGMVLMLFWFAQPKFASFYNEQKRLLMAS